MEPPPTTLKTDGSQNGKVLNQAPVGLLMGKPAFLAEDPSDPRRTSKEGSRVSSKDSTRVSSKGSSRASGSRSSSRGSSRGNSKSSTRTGDFVLSLAVDAQVTCDGDELPPEAKTRFVLKAYALVLFMLTATISITVPFLVRPQETLAWLQSNAWVPVTALSIFLLQWVLHVAVVCQVTCCGAGKLFDSYMRIFKTVPLNFTFLLVYSVCLGVVAGFACAHFAVESILLAFVITAALVVALSCYAYCARAEFSGIGAYALVFTLGLPLVLLVGATAPIGTLGDRMIGCVAAVVFGFIIVYDTQQILGSASWRFRVQRQMQFSVDMYIYAAWTLYLDFINFSLYILQVIFNRRQ